MGTPEKPTSTPVETEGGIRAVSELVLGSRVVYPNQGVCRVGEIQSKEIAGHRLDFISMTREEDDATILVPVNKVPSIGLRHVADSVEIGDVFDLLASSFDDPELDWKVRHRMHGDLMAAGGVLGVAEVLKALQALANLRPLPQKERERYDAARHLLVHEIAVAVGVPECTAEDFIDLALIPPPGTVRPASKPRRLATLPPKALQRPGRMAVRAGDEDLEDLGLLDEELPGLGIEEEGEGAEEEEAAGEAEEGAEAGEAERAEETAKKPKAKKAKAKKPKQAAAEAAGPAPAAEVAAPEPAAPAPGARPVTPAEPPAPAVEVPAPPAKPTPAEPTEAPPAAEEPARPAKATPAEATEAPPAVAGAAVPEAEAAPAPAPRAKKAPARKPAPAAEAREEKPRPAARKAGTGAKAPAKKAAAEPKAKAPAKKAATAAAREPAAKKAPAKKAAATKPAKPAAKSTKKK